MSVIKINELKFNYSELSETGNNPEKLKRPDGFELHREEKRNVVEFLNYLSNKYKLLKADCLELEKLIKTELPKDIKGKNLIEKWLYHKQIRAYVLNRGIPSKKK